MLQADETFQGALCQLHKLQRGRGGELLFPQREILPRPPAPHSSWQKARTQ